MGKGSLESRFNLSALRFSNFLFAHKSRNQPVRWEYG
jgi:hypothetical protein